MSDRDKFEAWCREEGINPDRSTHTDVYSYPSARVAWRAWQASRRAAMEEAAKVCDEISSRQAKSDAIARSKSSEKCAAAIRALAGTET